MEGTYGGEHGSGPATPFNSPHTPAVPFRPLGGPGQRTSPPTHPTTTSIWGTCNTFPENSESLAQIQTAASRPGRGVVCLAPIGVGNGSRSFAARASISVLGTISRPRSAGKTFPGLSIFCFSRLPSFSPSLLRSMRAPQSR
jgi:hypothetical protein